MVPIPATPDIDAVNAMRLDWRSAAKLYAVEMAAWLRRSNLLDPADWVETRHEDGLDNPQREAARVLRALHDRSQALAGP